MDCKTFSFTVICCCIFIMCGNAAVLSKPYTLKVPVLLPLSGATLALGKLCTEPIELFLSTINNRSDILPDYNIVYDIIDDQCSDTKGIANIFPFFMEKSRVVNMTTLNRKIGAYLAPSNATFMHETARTAYVAPVLVGPMCSAVCKAVSRYSHMFGLINFSAGCNVGTVSDRRTYPGLYRLLSDTQIADTLANFVYLMGWKKVTIISDTVITTFITTNVSIAAFNKANVTVLGVEFFSNDPAEAVSHVKESGARIIVANTPTDSIGTLFCAAYQQGLYGPKIVWIRLNSASALTGALPWGCTSQMVEQVEMGAFFYRQSPPDYMSTMTSFGITGRELDRFLEKHAPPELAKASTRMTCIDTVSPAVFILDKAERLLNAKGSTLRNYLSDSSDDNPETASLMRNAMSSIDIRLFAGRLRYEPGNQEVLVPSVFDQSQEGNVRRPVFEDKGVEADDRSRRFIFRNPMMWRTKNGRPPKAEPTVVIRMMQVPAWIVIIFSLLAVCLVMLIAFAIILNHCLAKKGTKCPTVYRLLNNCAVVGIMFLACAMVMFAWRNMVDFCCIAPPIAVIGFSLLIGALLLKVTRRYEQVMPVTTGRTKLRIVKSQSLNTSSKKKRNQVYMLVWLLINVTLCILWYALGGPPTIRQVQFPHYDENTDVLVEETWNTCASAVANTPEQTVYQEVFPGSIVALQSACLLAAFFAALIKRQNVADELKNCVMSIYVLFPATISAVLTVAMANTPDIIYYFVSVVVLVKGVAIGYLLFRMEVASYFLFIKQHLSPPFPHQFTLNALQPTPSPSPKPENPR